MFCPKCGIENPDDGKFCRKCGCDLTLIADVISGKLTVGSNNKIKKNKKEPALETALVLLSISLAFFISAAILAFQPMGAGWWFWLLFAAFPMLALGIGQMISLKQNEKDNIKFSSDKNSSLPESATAAALPAPQTEFVSGIFDIKRQPDDFAPPSVVEGTTRKLEMDSEGETINLPKTRK